MVWNDRTGRVGGNRTRSTGVFRHRSDIPTPAVWVANLFYYNCLWYVSAHKNHETRFSSPSLFLVLATVQRTDRPSTDPDGQLSSVCSRWSIFQGLRLCVCMPAWLFKQKQTLLGLVAKPQIYSKTAATDTKQVRNDHVEGWYDVIVRL